MFRSGGGGFDYNDDSGFGNELFSFGGYIDENLDVPNTGLGLDDSLGLMGGDGVNIQEEADPHLDEVNQLTNETFARTKEQNEPPDRKLQPPDEPPDGKRLVWRLKKR